MQLFSAETCSYSYSYLFPVALFAHFWVWQDCSIFLTVLVVGGGLAGFALVFRAHGLVVLHIIVVV